MTSPATDPLSLRLEGRALAVRRATVIVYEICMSDGHGTRLEPADPILVPAGASRLAAGLPYTLRSLRREPGHLLRSLPQTARAALHNLRGRSLGSVAILTRRPDASWAA